MMSSCDPAALLSAAVPKWPARCGSAPRDCAEALDAPVTANLASDGRFE
jgi:hypothetical protein